jgi:ACT domain-containing protein
MARRFITREDVLNEARDGLLEVDADDIITAAAEEIAARKGIRVERRAAATPLATPGPERAPVHAAAPMSAKLAPHVIVSAVGRNRGRVLAEITTRIADLEGSILDISQSIVKGYFSTLLIVDISNIGSDFKVFKDKLESLSKDGDYRLIVQHEETFRAMHRI